MIVWKFPGSDVLDFSFHSMKLFRMGFLRYDEPILAKKLGVTSWLERQERRVMV